MKLRNHRGLILALTLIVALALAAPTAYAEESTVLGATPVTATLSGNPWAGSYDNYQIAYPGNNVQIYVRFYSLSSDVITNDTLEFTLYRPYGGAEKGDKKEDGAYQEVSYASDDPGTLTVQVANYSRKAISYQIVVIGLPETEAATSVLTAVSGEPIVPATAQLGAVQTDAPTTLQGTLVGDSAGNFAEYRFSAVAGEELSLTMEYLPIDPSFGNAVNFRVYAPDGTLAAKGIEAEPRVWKDIFVAKYTGEYTLQVQNYAPGVTLTYTMAIAR